MPRIVKRSVRAILLNGNQLVLMRRTKPGRPPYWVAVGGGVELEDASLEAALRREVFEEVGGVLERAELVHLITEERPGGLAVQHIFAARLESMDVAARTGPEFSEPGRGEYDVVGVPFTAEAVGELNLMPPTLANFIAANIDAIAGVLAKSVRVAQ